MVEKFDEAELIQALRDKAYRYLARREYSVHELRQRLKNVAPSHLGEQVIQELVDQGSQSDARFAEMLCRSRFNSGKGPIKLKHELIQHEINSILIERSMAEFDDRWLALAEEVRVQKFGDRPPADFKEWAKQVRFLQQRGFDIEHTGQFYQC